MESSLSVILSSPVLEKESKLQGGLKYKEVEGILQKLGNFWLSLVAARLKLFLCSDIFVIKEIVAVIVLQAAALIFEHLIADVNKYQLTFEFLSILIAIITCTSPLTSGSAHGQLSRCLPHCSLNSLDSFSFCC